MDQEARLAALGERFEVAPYSKKLGVKAKSLTLGKAVFELPYQQENTTIADIVHGGAILGLADIAATAAAWTNVENPAEYRGITADLSLNFIASGRSQALIAEAIILKQGKSLTYVEVKVENEAGELVSKCLVTYKLSKIK